jgi:hypothetical protein
MNVIHLDPQSTDVNRREKLFNGDFVFYSGTASFSALVDHARAWTERALGADSEKAQYRLALDAFIPAASGLKSGFTNDLQTKVLVRNVLESFGCDLDTTYFDVPRLRVVTSDNYLTAGVGYAYKAHRDTWYSSPESQINWWLPVFDLAHDNTMSMYPGYWSRPIPNSSQEFDYQEWCAIGRKMAVGQVGTDSRRHPLPTEEVRSDSESRFVLSSGEVMLFSASHLHATAPNTSGKTRFSIDFRTVHVDDLVNRRGARNIDNRSTGTTLGDFLHARDFSPIEPHVVEQYVKAELHVS